MYNHSSKAQVEYSLRQLSAGLFFLLGTHPFEKITVTDICRQAGITRRTFYRNCEDKTDLILYSTDYLVSHLLQSVDFQSRDPRMLYQGFFRYWYQHRQFLGLLYKNNLFPVFQNEFTLVCNASMRYPLQEQHLAGARNRLQMQLFSNAFVVGGLGQMLKQWAEEDFSSSPDEVAGAILFLAPGAQRDL